MNIFKRVAFSLSGALGPAVVAVLILGMATFSAPAPAEGIFIDAPNRTDIAFDDKRGVLYISSGGQLLRYELASKSFLSPLNLGGVLGGMDISPDGESLVVADDSNAGGRVWVYIVSLATLNYQQITFLLASPEAGTFTAAYGSNGGILVTSRVLPGWSSTAPLRRYDPATHTTTVLASVDQDTMLRASADHTIIALAEPNSSDGPFDRYRVSDGNLLRKSASTGTQWFNDEIAVRPDGQQYAIPTGDGTFLADASLALSPTLVGIYRNGPVGVVYDPVKPLVYFPWESTNLVYAYDSTALTVVRSYDFESQFGMGGIAFTDGRAKTSSDGALLFVTVTGGVRYITLNAVAPSGLAATPAVGSVTLHWSASPNAASYVVYQGTGPGQEAPTPVLSGIVGTSATLPGLKSDTVYYFKVAAVTPEGLSTPTTEVAATPIGLPGLITGFTANAYPGAGFISLAWNPAVGASSYTLYQSNTSGHESSTVPGITANFFSAAMSGYGNSYFFQLAAMNASGTGPRSAEISVIPAAIPVPSIPSGTYSSRQALVLTCATASSNVYYTTDGSAPSAASSMYTLPLQIETNTVVRAFCTATGTSNSAILTASYIIAIPAQSVSLAALANVYGIASEGQPPLGHGLDGDGNAYSEALIGNTVSWSGTNFAMGAENTQDALSGGTVSLPLGHYSAIKLLATGVNGQQLNCPIVVSYMDGTSTTFTQNISDWHSPQNFIGESIALSMAYRVTATGARKTGPYSLYGYAFPLDPTKSIKSVTLPNNRAVVVLGMTLAPAPGLTAVLVDLGGAANTYAVLANPITSPGIDGQGNAYVAQFLGNYLTWSGIVFQMPRPNQPDAIEHVTAPLTVGKYSQAYLLGTGVNGNQANRTIQISYTDGTTDSVLQSFSDWKTPQHYPGEVVVLSTPYRIRLDGTTQTGPYDIYGYSVKLNPLKVVASLTLPNANVAVLAVTLVP